MTMYGPIEFLRPIEFNTGRHYDERGQVIRAVALVQDKIIVFVDLSRCIDGVVDLDVDPCQITDEAVRNL
ncbi:MAG: hypothetical protein OEX14_00190, partial [Paracoccaceae bacterium]|nr:hypothetical protein [Paracoccaceae bacterium]